MMDEKWVLSSIQNQWMDARGIKRSMAVCLLLVSLVFLFSVSAFSEEDVAATVRVNTTTNCAFQAGEAQAVSFTPGYDGRFSFALSGLSTEGTTDWAIIDPSTGSIVASGQSDGAASCTVNGDLEAGKAYHLQLISPADQTIGIRPAMVPWYMEDGVLYVQDQTEANRSTTSVSWYSRREEITDVVIGGNVTSLTSNFMNSSNSTPKRYPNLRSVVIGNNVTTIGASAFRYSPALESIQIGDKVTTINGYAFSSCPALQSVEIPASVKSITNTAFRNDTNLESVVFDEENLMTTLSTGLFQSLTKLREVVLPRDLTAIPSSTFYGCTGLESIEIPATVKSIDSSAFQNCSKLTEIELPRHLEKIDTSAFNGCTGLTEINLPDTLKTINGSAFNNTGITSVTVPASVTTMGTSVFSNCKSLEYANLENATGLTALPNSTFSACNKLETVLLPDSLTSIGDYAFNACQAMEEITIPDGVTAIGNYAFNTCQKLSVINGGPEGVLNLPDSVTAIGSNAFNNCDQLKEVTVPDIVTSLGASAFAYCDSLESAVIGEGIDKLPNNLFQNDTKLKHIEIKSDKITEIPDYFVYNCTQLQDFPLWEGLTRIGTYAFYYSGITEQEFPASLTSISSYAYYNCTKLKEIEFSPDGTEPLTIGTGAFNGCTGLTEVDFPANIREIGTNAFYNNYNLTDVTFTENPDQELTIGSYAFYNNYRIKKLDFPGNLTSIGNNAFQSCSGLTSVTFPEDGKLTSIGNSAFYSCSGLTSVTFPEDGNLTSIGNSAFYSCSGLTSVTFPENGKLTQIGNSAFYSCSQLKEIDLPDGVESIGSSAFYNCSSITELDMPDTVTSLGSSAFSSCTKLQDVHLSEGLTDIPSSAFSSCSNLRRVDYPDNVQSIGASAFQNCIELPSVELPDSVKTIGASAYSGCTKVDTITIPANCETIGANAFNNCKNLNSLVWDAKDCEIASFASNASYTLTIGKNVDNISQTSMNNLLKSGDGKSIPGAKDIVFEGGNYLTLPSLAGSDLPRPLRNLDAGKYYADEQGALYLIRDDGTAQLAYVPDGLASYTVPASLPGEGGGAVPVTSVKNNALYRAQSLTALTIEAPEQMTEIESHAFAHARNLESVNGETRRSAAQALFTQAQIGVDIFDETKLTEDDPKPTHDGAITYNGQLDSGDAAAGWPTDGTLAVFIEQTGATRRQAGSDEPRANVGGLTRDPETGAYLAYTGEAITTTISITNPSDDDLAVGQGDKIRVYFQVEDGGSMGYPLGENTIILTKNNVPTGKTVQINVFETDVNGVFCFEVDRPLNGGTATIDIPNIFTSPNTPGGNMKVWAEYFTAEQAAATAGQARTPSDKYHLLNWSTLRDEYDLTKIRNNTPTISVGNNGQPYLSGTHRYDLNLSRKANTVSTEGIAKDKMVSTDFVDVLTLEDGLRFNPQVLQEIMNGTLGTSVSGNYKYFYSNALGANAFGFYSNNASLNNYVTPKIEYLNEKQIKFTWTVRNDKLESVGKEDFASFMARFYIYEKVLELEEGTQPGQVFTVKNDVDVVEHYSYSEDAADDAHASASVTAGGVSLSMTKAGADGIRGEYNPYTVTIRNNGIVAATTQDLKPLADTIDDSYNRHYMKANDIYRLLTDPEFGGAATLTIGSAHLYGQDGTLPNTWKAVWMTDGSQGYTDQENTSYNPNYSSSYNGTTNSDPYDTIRSAKFVLTSNGNGTASWALYKSGDATQAPDAAGTVASGSDIQSVFDQFGFFVTRETTYRVDWNLEKLDNFTIEPGETKTLVIPTTLKDVFQTVTGDTVEWLNDRQRIYNRIYARNALNQETSSQRSLYVNNDASIYKGYEPVESHPFQQDYTDISILDTVEYHTTVSHSGSGQYPLMPVTDHMTGMQYLLAPVSGNEGKDWTQGLEIYLCKEGTEDEEAYYALNQAGVYDQVWTGSALADHVEVRSSSEKNWDTYLFWYLPDYGGSYSKVLRYKAKTLYNDYHPGTAVTSLFNETWLGDHQSHRLYDWTAYTGEYAVKPYLTGWEKKIVDWVGDTSEGYDYCPVTKGRQVIYRLKLWNDYDDQFVLNGTQIYDILPEVYGFEWTRDGENRNIRLDYRGFETNDPQDEKWKVVPEAGKEYTRRLKWDDDFEMTCNDPGGIGYIYVTLNFPDDISWDSYVMKFNKQRLDNTLFVNVYGNAWYNDAVEHDLMDDIVVRLQKGVYATGGEINDQYKTSVYRGGGESRTTFENDNVLRGKVYYYVTLHNGGKTNLYLNDIQDVLPPGFTLCSVSLASSSYATVSGAEYVSSYSVLNYTTGETAASSGSSEEKNQQTVTLTFKPAVSNLGRTPSSSELTNPSVMQYNDQLKKYYLKPNQAAVFRIDCYTNQYEDTPDVALNAVAMPIWNDYHLDVSVGDAASTSVNRSETANAQKNDGGCDMIDRGTADGRGFDTQGQSGSSQWLYSEVELHRGAIQPGILKSVEASFTTDAEGKETRTDHPVTVNPLDRILWRVTARNDGADSILDYALSDELPAPYCFSGDVTFIQSYNNLGSNSQQVRLFGIEDRKTADHTASPTMTFVTYSASGSVVGSYPYTLGGAPVEMEIPAWTVGIAQQERPKIQVSIHKEGDNEVMRIHFPSDSMCLPDSGKVELLVSTENLTATMQNTVFYNTCFLTPLQQTWGGAPSEGNETNFDTGFGGYTHSVRNSAQITTSYGGFTTAIKEIQEIGNASNHTDSEKVINYITLEDKSKLFTYTLNVTNESSRAVERIVLIDNLPELNDHTTFLDSNPRNSPFTVEMCASPDFRLWVNKVDGTSVTVPSNLYTIQVGYHTSFGNQDWSGEDMPQWTDWNAFCAQHSGDLEEAVRSIRSIRMIFEEQNIGSNYFGAYFSPRANMSLTFNARISPDDPNAQPGLIAWNNFGYHYRFAGLSTELEAAPLVVGIRIPDYPSVQKTLINRRSGSYLAEEDETFRYVLYEGANLSGITANSAEDEIISLLESRSCAYTIGEVTVPRGQNASQVSLSFNRQTGHFPQAGGGWEEKEWSMKNGKTYTLVEINAPDGRFASSRLGGTQGNVYSFTYKANEDALQIASVNIHDDWSLALKKTDQFDHAVGKAVFAIYTQQKNEAMLYSRTEQEPGARADIAEDTGESAYEAMTLEELNQRWSLSVPLEEKPAYQVSFQAEGDDAPQQYLLMTVMETLGYGSFQVDELSGETYLYQEVAAPEHYEMTDEGVLHAVHREAQSSQTIITVTAENHYLAEGSAPISILKRMEGGRPLKSGEFSFTLEPYDLENKRVIPADDPACPPMPELTEAENGEDGWVSFGNVALTEADIGNKYYYVIRETLPEEGDRLPHVIYDTNAYIAALAVTDQEEGKVSGDITYSYFNEKGEQITLKENEGITNRFENEASVSLRLSKELEGREWRAEETFTINLLETTPDKSAEDLLQETFLLGDAEGNGTIVTQAERTLAYTQDDIGQTYVYRLWETVPQDAVGYNGQTGEKYRLSNGKDLTYQRYQALPDSATGKQRYLNVYWKKQGIVYDDQDHILSVTLSYDEQQNAMKADAYLDGVLVTEPAAVVTVRNRYDLDPAKVTLSAAKELVGRPWLRSIYDTYKVELVGENSDNPLPNPAVLTIDSNDDAVEGNAKARTREFPTLFFTRNALRNSDGTYETSKEFYYNLQEKLDLDDPKAKVIRDAEGSLTEYRKDNIVYDLSKLRVKITLTEEDSALSATVKYWDDETDAWADTPPSVTFTNQYRLEPVGFQVPVRKLIDQQNAKEGDDYTFVLYKIEDGKEKTVQVLSLLDSTIQDGTALFRINEELGTEEGAPLALGQSRTYTYYLKEQIPDEAIGYREGIPLKNRYGEATPEQKQDRSIHWNDRGVTYDGGVTAVNVTVRYNTLTYLLESTVSLMSGGSRLSTAVFGNSTEIHAQGGFALRIGKEIDGRDWNTADEFTFELTGLDGAPVRGISEADAEEMYALKDAVTLTLNQENPYAFFDELVFLEEDLVRDGEPVIDQYFSYRVHEVVPDGATVETEGHTVLTYGKATEEEREKYAGSWVYRGLVYDTDHLFTLHVSRDPQEPDRLTVAFMNSTSRWIVSKR